MSNQGRSLQEIFADLWPEAELAKLGERIGSQLPHADFHRAIFDVVVVVIKVAISNPHPWREQKRGLALVAKRAKKAAAAVRQLDEAFDDSRWVHDRQQLMGAAGWTGPDLVGLAAQLENLALPAKGMKEKPQHEVYAIFVQLLVPVFKAATGGPPRFTFDPYGERYTGAFIELVESVWAKILMAAEDANLAIEGPRGNVAVGKAAQRLVRLMDKT